MMRSRGKFIGVFFLFFFDKWRGPGLVSMVDRFGQDGSLRQWKKIRLCLDQICIIHMDFIGQRHKDHAKGMKIMQKGWRPCQRFGNLAEGMEAMPKVY